MDVPYRETVLRRLAERHPASILNIGPLGEALFRGYLDARPQTGYLSLRPREAHARLSALPRFALAFVAGAFETLGPQDATRLLARLRDVQAAHLLLAVDSGSESETRREANDLIALGLQLIEEHPEGVALYEFDIARYKLTPDWLNSEHWAHPELFDKFRW
ncbi:hypothetical protein SVA_3687 [Sulfurifustis variabilis]|uniref:Uncharacterized protein n=1 Tax=Sulfurifustis variabilis TaxID=1675686 RepID=A0A1C7AFR3_9GAMM|nr:DUF6231 family protein [Sulfurifustis variabilis]BAU50223.1 hypothetical protein SVA_3687 [Sulfurifustis variabilis]